jgi:hypothetical protein
MCTLQIFVTTNICKSTHLFIYWDTHLSDRDDGLGKLSSWLRPAIASLPRSAKNTKKTANFQTPIDIGSLWQGCQIFLGATYQKKEKYTKWPPNVVYACTKKP